MVSVRFKYNLICFSFYGFVGLNHCTVCRLYFGSIGLMSLGVEYNQNVTDRLSMKNTVVGKKSL